MVGYLLGILAAILTVANAIAGERCFVRAPSNNPTMVRHELNSLLPAGEIPNGTQVSMWRVEKDPSGQRWAYVTAVGQDGQGYLLRDFLVCF
jgi:hypothetical protein